MTQLYLIMPYTFPYDMLKFNIHLMGQEMMSQSGTDCHSGKSQITQMVSPKAGDR